MSLECPMCGFNKTDPSRHEKGKWFCYLCGVTWNPETENYDHDLEIWITWTGKVWIDDKGNIVY